jgi:aspartate oxidase
MISLDHRRALDVANAAERSAASTRERLLEAAEVGFEADGLKVIERTIESIPPEEIAALRERFKKVRVFDSSDVFNTNLLQVLELRNMLDLSETVAAGAYAREESRGSHTRTDFPTRDDGKWHKHTMATLVDGKLELGEKPVTMGRYELQERTY